MAVWFFNWTESLPEKGWSVSANVLEQGYNNLQRKNKIIFIKLIIKSSHIL